MPIFQNSGFFPKTAFSFFIKNYKNGGEFLIEARPVKSFEELLASQSNELISFRSKVNEKNALLHFGETFGKAHFN